MKRILVFITFITMTNLSLAKVEKWIIDESHSKIGFEVPHMIISSVEGRFGKFKGEIQYDTEEKNPQAVNQTTQFMTEIETASISTENDKRDSHLKGPDFFNIKKKGHDKIMFKSNKVASNDGKRLKVSGDLTLNNVTKKVTIDMRYKGMAKAYRVNRIVFKGKLKIKREDFNLAWNDGVVKASNMAGKVAEATGAIGSEVSIQLSIQAQRAIDLKQ